MKANPVGSPQENEWLRPIFAVLVPVLSASVILNSAVLYIFITCRKTLLNNSNNLLLFSMSFADFLVSVCGVVSSAAFISSYDKFVIWKLAIVLQMGSFLISMLSVSLMTADRMISVKCALRYNRIVTTAKIKIVLMIVWLLVSAITSMHILMYIFMSPEVELKVRSILESVIFVISGIILAVSNFLLHKEVKKKLKYDQIQNLVEIKKVSICVWLTMLFLVCCSPMSVAYFSIVVVSSNNDEWIQFLMATGFIFAASNSLLNPTVYFWKRKDFRKFVTRIVYRRLQGRIRPELKVRLTNKNTIRTDSQFGSAGDNEKELGRTHKI